MASFVTKRSIQDDLYAKVQMNFLTSGSMCYMLFWLTSVEQVSLIWSWHLVTRVNTMQIRERYTYLELIHHSKL